MLIAAVVLHILRLNQQCLPGYNMFVAEMPEMKSRVRRIWNMTILDFN
jgi:hypothetical protein